jgi:protease-4
MRAALLAALILFSLPVGADTKSPDLLEIIEVSGVIDMHTASQAKEAVESINENKAVKAVLLVVDSPGGGVLATSAVYDELAKLKVPVVAFCPYVCASGGLYIMMAPTVKYVGVRGDAISGSVGVIAQTTRYNRLLDWAMIDVDTFKSGELKDTGNPTRDATEKDKAYMQGIVDTLAKQFYGVVDKAREITDWEAVKSARIFIGDQAVKVGLVDSVMSREEAIEKAKELSGSENIYTRDELKQMSKIADVGRYEMSPYESAVSLVLELAGEIRQGESTKFLYLMDARF